MLGRAVVRFGARQRGTERGELIDALVAVEPSTVPRLFAEYDLVLWW